LTLYKTPKAREFLEPLAWRDIFVRFNAVNALTTLADERSIPYLIKALGMEDPNQSQSPGFITRQAYGTIGKVLGPDAQGGGILFAHSKDDIEAIKEWWAKENRRPAATKPGG